MNSPTIYLATLFLLLVSCGKPPAGDHNQTHIEQVESITVEPVDVESPSINETRAEVIESTSSEDSTPQTPVSESGASPQSPTAHSDNSPSDDRWEYLIVSFGKTRFTEMRGAMTDGLSKLSALKDYTEQLGGSEALDTQEKLDLIGLLEWELSGVLGTIGGDQQLLFKRRVVEDRAEREAIAIASVSSVLKATQNRIQAIAEARSSLNAGPKLIEIDAEEQRTRERLAAQKARELVDSLIPPKWGTLVDRGTIALREVTANAWERNDTYLYGKSATDRMDVDVYAKIELDATRTLLTGNRYRSSEAHSCAETAIMEFVKPLKANRELFAEYKLIDRDARNYAISEPLSGLNLNVKVELTVFVTLGETKHQIAATSIAVFGDD